MFVARLRKYLRTRRVTSVSQIGTDRVIEIQFSDGQYRLFLEFYAGGNIVLADKDLTILSLFRIVAEGADQEELRVGLKYSLSNRQNFDIVPSLSKERVRDGLQHFVDKAEVDGMTSAKKSKKKPGDALRRALVISLGEFPPTLIDHALKVVAFDPVTTIEQVLLDDALLDSLMIVLAEAESVVEKIMKSANPKGYIISKRIKSKGPEGGVKCVSKLSQGEGYETLLYEDFHPFRPQQYEENPEVAILEFDGFNTTVDTFFSSVEAQKLESRLTEREEHARNRLEAARLDHQKRLGKLHQVQEMHVRKAQAIEANLRGVQEAVAAINGLIAQGMDWVEIARLIEVEQAKHNVVAELIELPLKLYENSVTLALTEPKFDDEEDFEGNETGSDISNSEAELVEGRISSKAFKESEDKLLVDIDLALSPWSNARQYYEQKKTAAAKEQRTLLSSSKALKSTEKKISADLKKGMKQEKQILRPVRQQLWFEKFFFFISSDGYLVLAGKDAQQSDILYKRHLVRGDIYVHADLQGAKPVFIKNRYGRPDDLIPPSTLSQAGVLTVATSSAWESKALMPAWWVRAEQVTKMTLTGDYLASGEFSIREPKSFLPPAHLMLGFGLFFRVSEEGKIRHLKHRVRDDCNASPIHNNLSDEIINDTNVLQESVDEIKFEKGPYGQIEPSTIQSDSKREYEDSSAAGTASQSYGRGDSDLCDSNAKDFHLLRPNPLNDDNHHSFKAGDASTAAGEALDSKTFSSKLIGEDKQSKYKDGSHLPQRGKGEYGRRSSSIADDDEISDQAGFPKIDHESNIVDTTDAPNPPASVPIPTSFTSVSSKKVPPVRGKRGKIKKIKGKYANQDDEDRAFALRLLGSAVAIEKIEEDATAKLSQERHRATQNQRRSEQHALASELGKKEEEIRKIKFEERNQAPEDEAGESIDMDTLVGKPLPGDEILDMLVVCGPWDALGGKCKWRAKLQPGATKKGKVVREILGNWLSLVAEREKRKNFSTSQGDAETATEERTESRESELLMGIKEQEVVGVVPVSNCRVVMGTLGVGGSKAKGGGNVSKGQRGGRGSKKQR